MLKKLNVEQVEEFWEVIETAVVGKLQPISDANPEQIKAGLMKEWVQCFAILEEDQDPQLRGFVLGAVTLDPLTMNPSYMIMCAEALYEVQGHVWADALVVIMNEAAKNNCKNLVGFTRDAGVIQLASQANACTDFMYLNMNLSNRGDVK